MRGQAHQQEMLKRTHTLMGRHASDFAPADAMDLARAQSMDAGPEELVVDKLLMEMQLLDTDPLLAAKQKLRASDRRNATGDFRILPVGAWHK